MHFLPTSSKNLTDIYYLFIHLECEEGQSNQILYELFLLLHVLLRQFRLINSKTFP